MSWTITERSQTGEVQYIIATHPNITGAGTSGILNVSGYTKGTISFKIPFGSTAKTMIEGSLDSVNWFSVTGSSPPALSPGTHKFNWLLTLKFVRFKVAAGGLSPITDIVLIAEY